MAVNSEDIGMISKRDGWLFNWRKEYQKNLHVINKFSLINMKIIEGLISLEANESHKFIEMHLIENAPGNKGKHRNIMALHRRW